MTGNLSAWTADAWQSAQAQIPAPSWLNEWRGQQLQQFLQRGFPQRRDESWKYTSVAALVGQSFRLPEIALPHPALDLSAYRVADTYRMVFIDGVFSSQFSDFNDFPEKITLTSCTDAMARFPQIYQERVAASSSSALSVFHWLNGALMTDGLFLSVPDNCELSKPVHLLYLTTNSSNGSTMRHPRHIIHLGAQSRAAVLEEYCGLDGSHYFNNIMTKITVSQNAQLDYFKLQRENTDAFHIANTCVDQSRDSLIRAFHIALGGQLNREDLNVALNEAGAQCELSGYYYPRARQHIDFHTRIDHHRAHTNSQQYYKGMIASQGRAVFNGKIIVHPKAQHITARQENHNLLLEDSAEIDTKPELEVFADNVQCTHAATVGNLDANALFYLRSRGIPEELARHLLMRGFAEEILNLLPSPQIAQYLQTVMGE